MAGDQCLEVGNGDVDLCTLLEFEVCVDPVHLPAQRDMIPEFESEGDRDGTGCRTDASGPRSGIAQDFSAETISVGKPNCAMYSRRIREKPRSSNTGAASTPRQFAVRLRPRA